MALILNIETATTNCSVSLSKDGETVVLKEDYNNNYSHSETLHVYIDSLFKSNKISPTDIDAVAVSKGPGSYTGLRIGVSAAKGFCFALDKPLISVSTLESLARQVKVKDGYILPMLDARREEVYSAVFDSDYKLVRDIKAQILNKSSFENYLNQEAVYFIGNGVPKTKVILAPNQSAQFIDDKLPSANEMGYISERKYQAGNFEDVAYFEPFYLKDFIALKPKG